MKTYLQKIVAFINDEEGASAVEYGLLVGLIAVVIIVAVTALGSQAQRFVPGYHGGASLTDGARGRSLRASAPFLRENSALPSA